MRVAVKWGQDSMMCVAERHSMWSIEVDQIVQILI